MQDYNYFLLLITATATPIITRAAIAPTIASISTLDMPLDGILVEALDVNVIVCDMLDPFMLSDPDNGATLYPVILLTL